MKKCILLIALISVVTGCSEQTRAKNWGGTMHVDLPNGKKLVTVAWKESDLWYLTKDMKESDTPETFYFNEDSRWGLVEGTVIITEHK